MQKSRYLKNLDAVLAALIGWFILSLFFKYSGVGVSPDSIMYTSAARSFKSHGNLFTFNHVPIVDFPVFYPIYLGIISFITQIDPVKFGAIMNGIMFAALIFTSGWIMERFVPASRVYKWLMLAAIILSPPLLQVYSYLWSETLFILEILFFFGSLQAVPPYAYNQSIDHSSCNCCPELYHPLCRSYYCRYRRLTFTAGQGFTVKKENRSYYYLRSSLYLIIGKQLGFQCFCNRYNNRSTRTIYYTIQ